jgi:hypothetical protein
MTEAEAVSIMRNHLEGLFPKVCPSCKRFFATLQEYLQITQHLGPAMPYDADSGDWRPLRPLGTMTFANCPCKNTLVLSSEGMPIVRYWSLLRWARIETHRRGVTPQELFNHIRDEICKQVLTEPCQLARG